MEGTKNELEKVAKICRTIAVTDAVLGFICAANGDSLFMAFMFLAGGMWAYGSWIQSKADNLQGE